MAANGYLPDGALVYVEDNDRLIPSAASAFLAFKAYAASQGRTLNIAEPAGSYRSYATQADMLAHPERYGLNKASKAGLARAGFSGHGFGNRVDLVGTSLDWIVKHALDFGFIREFGTNDPNHFKHDGVTATAGGNTTPIDNSAPVAPRSKGSRMSFSLIPIPERGGTVAASLITGLETGLASPYHASTMLRFRENIGADNMLAGEVAFCRGYLALINPTPALLAFDYSKIEAVIKATITDPNDDDWRSAENEQTEKILASIATITSSASISPDQVAEKVDALLAGRFDHLPASIVDLQAKRLGNG